MDNCVVGKSISKCGEENTSLNKTAGAGETEEVVTGANRASKRYMEDEITSHYPKQLKLMFGPLKCDLCSVVGNSTLTMFTHYRGKSHQKKVDKYLKDNSIEIDNSNKKPKKEFVTTTCDLCNVTLTSELQSLQHYSGKSHKKKMANSGSGVETVKVAKESYDASGRFGIGKSFAPPVPSSVENTTEPPKGSDENVRFCSVCNVFTTCGETLSSHMMGSKHQKKLALERAANANSLAKYRTPSDYYYCPLCNVSANSPDQFLVHLNSKKHSNHSKKDGT